MGERAGSALPKQFALIGGRPLLVWSLDLLQEGGCDPIVVVVPNDHMERTRALLSGRRDVVLAAGGATRQDSVRAGLEKVTARRVVIHDAARPFASPGSVRQVVDALDDVDGAVVAVPVQDTIKQVAGSGVIVSTIDRSQLWHSQTPQAFKTEVLRRAHDTARADGVFATDDAELVERAGHKVVVVRGDAANIKITEAADLELAELIAQRRRR